MYHKPEKLKDELLTQFCGQVSSSKLFFGYNVVGNQSNNFAM